MDSFLGEMRKLSVGKKNTGQKKVQSCPPMRRPVLTKYQGPGTLAPRVIAINQEFRERNKLIKQVLPTEIFYPRGSDGSSRTDRSNLSFRFGRYLSRKKPKSAPAGLTWHDGERGGPGVIIPENEMKWEVVTVSEPDVEPERLRRNPFYINVTDEDRCERPPTSMSEPSEVIEAISNMDLGHGTGSRNNPVQID